MAKSKSRKVQVTFTAEVADPAPNGRRWSQRSIVEIIRRTDLLPLTNVRALKVAELEERPYQERPFLATDD